MDVWLFFSSPMFLRAAGAGQGPAVGLSKSQETTKTCAWSRRGLYSAFSGPYFSAFGSNITLFRDSLAGILNFDRLCR